MIKLSPLLLSKLYVFYHVYKEGNITKASRKILLSQPALSRAIMSLEGQVKQKLFDRKIVKDQRHLSFTPFAHRLFQEVEKIFFSLERTLRSVNDIKEINPLYIHEKIDAWEKQGITFSLLKDTMRIVGKKYLLTGDFKKEIEALHEDIMVALKERREIETYEL